MDSTFDATQSNFSVWDYVIFGLMLAISAAIGFYYSYKDRNKQNTEEFLLGGRSMSPYPVAVSLSVSFMSGVLVLGTPSDIYVFGTMYIWIVVSFLIAAIISSEIYIPIFYNMGLKTVYEYLEYRFHRAVRICATLVYIAYSIIFLGVVIYAPALALNAVTGFNIWGSVIATGSVCIIYSTLGGLKAVVWTDVLQMIVMVIGFLSLIIQGSIKAGGIEKIWKNAEEGNRLILWRFSFDPRLQYSVWSVVIGGGFTITSIHAANQNLVQRYLSCRTLADAKKSVLLNCVALFFLNVLAVLAGIVIYGYYYGCDPLQYVGLSSRDQLVPYFTLDIFRDNPGMPGLILATVYSGSLSTVSTAITALSSVTISDFLKPNFNWTEKTFVWVARGLVVFYGILSMIFAYITSQLQGLLQLAISIQSIIGGPMLGLFTLGILFPCANTFGAIAGLMIGLAMNVWVFVGGLEYRFYSAQFQGFLPLSTDKCPVNTSAYSNITTTAAANLYESTIMDLTNAPTMKEVPAVAQIYSMSYWYISVWGFIFTMVVGLLVSFITCGHRNIKRVNPRYIHPFFNHWLFSCLPKSFKKFTWCGVPHDQTEVDEKVEKDGIDNPDFIITKC